MFMNWRDDVVIEETVKYCSTCRYGHLDELCDRTCVNADSERCADWVGDDDACPEWAEVNDEQA